jgi:limonene-1,2-epoxide hydrolase
MSKQTIERFYAAFSNLDAAAMEACYAESARFEDEAFSLAGRRQIGAMWRMLCEGARMNGIANWKLEVSDIRASAAKGRAHWEAHYLYGPRRRKVHNRIDAKFDFDDAGLIVRHRDQFNMWNWARQALGLPGLMLGWSPWLRTKVRSSAAQQLQRYVEKNR